MNSEHAISTLCKSLKKVKVYYKFTTLGVLVVLNKRLGLTWFPWIGWHMASSYKRTEVYYKKSSLRQAPFGNKRASFFLVPFLCSTSVSLTFASPSLSPLSLYLSNLRKRSVYLFSLEVSRGKREWSICQGQLRARVVVS